MIERFRPFVAPVYLILCLVAGGSSQGYWGNALLRILAIVIIAWALIERSDRPVPRGMKQLFLLAGLGIGLGIVQLIPIPTEIWASLAGRGQFVDGFRLLGVDPGFMPISLVPYDTIAALLALLPPAAVVAALVGLRGYNKGLLAAGLIVGTMLAVLLGILQVTSADPPNSPWYLYERTNHGLATGFFANSNHMASLLLVTIPFIVALGVTVRKRAKDARLGPAVLAVVGGAVLVAILGLFLNGSLAGYGLVLPVALASLLMLVGVRASIVRLVLAVAGVGSLAALAVLWASPVNQDAATSVSSRQAILVNSMELIREFGPVGTGLGTFEKGYRLSEQPSAVDRYFVNHAHDDYLELAIETGLPGIALLLLFLAWWVRSVWQMLKSPDADEFAYSGAIASAALLLHSAVDYPLRNAAMSAVFAMCLTFIVVSRRAARGKTDLRPARHVVVG